MRVVRPLIACAVAAAAFAAPSAQAVGDCVTVKGFGGACVFVDPRSPQPVQVSCGGYNWTCG